MEKKKRVGLVEKLFNFSKFLLLEKWLGSLKNPNWVLAL